MQVPEGNVTRWETGQDGLDKLKMTTAPMPVPGMDEVLIEIKTVSLNYRDTEVAMGLYTHHKSVSATQSIVPCSDMCGTVVAVGPSSSSSSPPPWKIGDRVLSIFNQTHLAGQIKNEHMSYGLGLPLDGVLQTHRVFPVTGLIKAPDHLSDEEACTLPVAGVTAWMAINGMRTFGQPGGQGEIILLQGTGGVSIMGLLIAVASGAETIVISSSDSKLDRARSLGATHTINYRADPKWHETIMSLTSNHGCDIIFENGGAKTLSKSFACVAFGGLINCIGYLSGKQDDPSTTTNVNVLALQRNVTLKGLLNGPKDRFEEMLRFLDAKQVADIRSKVVDRVFGFDEADAALEYLFQGAHFGKVVVRVKS